jgi:hypothetical protein
MLLGLVSVPPAFAQRNLPSDVEQHYGIPPNAANRDRGRGRYRNPPSDWEQQTRRRAYRNYGYYEDRRRYRPSRQRYGYGYYYR